jgi:NADH-quinone oxidoreductase subunit E
LTTKETKGRAKLNLPAIDSIVQKHSNNRGAIIAVLQEIQNTYGYVPAAAIMQVSKGTGVPAADIYGIVTFYSQFRMTPLGDHLIKVCHGTACHLNGAEMIADSLTPVVGAKEGETSADNRYTVERVACLGCCSLAPTIMIDSDTYGRLTPDNVRKVIKEFEKGKASPATESAK